MEWADEKVVIIVYWSELLYSPFLLKFVTSWRIMGKVNQSESWEGRMLLDKLEENAMILVSYSGEWSWNEHRGKHVYKFLLSWYWIGIRRIKACGNIFRSIKKKATSLLLELTQKRANASLPFVASSNMPTMHQTLQTSVSSWSLMFCVNVRKHAYIF